MGGGICKSQTTESQLPSGCRVHILVNPSEENSREFKGFSPPHQHLWDVSKVVPALLLVTTNGEIPAGSNKDATEQVVSN